MFCYHHDISKCTQLLGWSQILDVNNYGQKASTTSNIKWKARDLFLKK